MANWSCRSLWVSLTITNLRTFIGLGCSRWKRRRRRCFRGWYARYAVLWQFPTYCKPHILQLICVVWMLQPLHSCQPLTGGGQADRSCVCVCLSHVLSHASELNTSISNLGVCVFFDRADVRDTINGSYLFKMTRSSIICLPPWIQSWCENCFFHLLSSKKTTAYIKNKDGFEFDLFFVCFFVQSQPPLPLSLAFLLLLPSLQQSTYGSAFLSSLIIWTPLSLSLSAVHSFALSPSLFLSLHVNSSQDQTCFLCPTGFHSEGEWVWGGRRKRQKV